MSVYGALLSNIHVCVRIGCHIWCNDHRYLCTYNLGEPDTCSIGAAFSSMGADTTTLYQTTQEQRLAVLDEEGADLWKQAEIAFALREEEQNEGSMELALQHAASDDIEVHLCPGPSCVHCEPTKEGLVCRVSGLAWPRFATHDAIAAGHVLSHDDNGVPSSEQEDLRRKYVSRARDAYQASQLAYACANSNICHNDDEFIAYGIKQELSHWRHASNIKRRAPSQSRRCRTSKRDITRINLNALVAEAMIMFDRLVKYDGIKYEQRSAQGRSRLTCPGDTNREFSTNGKDIRYYVEMCQANGEEVNLDKLHGMLRQHDADKLMDGRRNVMRNEHDKYTAWYRSVREHASKLAVCLWKCAVNSPYMKNGRRTSDNFRPFIAGIFFSTRRGVKLENDMVLIPRCLTIASALPRTRVTTQPSDTHHIHMSSHKGVCTLQKSIRSVSATDRDAFFADAIQIARVLYEIDRMKSR